MKKQLWWMAAVVALTALAGCGSSVKLDEKPAPTSTATPTPAQPRQSQSGPVQTVDVTKAQESGKGPAGVSPSIYFDYDQFVIKDEYKPVVDGHAKFLSANAGRRVSLEGHADERGSREYNLALGQKRADAVRRALALLGVKDEQMEAVSFGKEKPRNPGHDEAAWAENRRVDFNYK
jgi:peptidoglycan-associated lipoprotein